MAQLENLRAHEKYNLLLCMVSGAYKGTIPGNENFKELCDECTLGYFAHDETKRLSTSILNSCVKRITSLAL
ncbi:hypothetical protein BTM304_14400 [Helicobacter pylori]